MEREVSGMQLAVFQFFSSALRLRSRLDAATGSVTEHDGKATAKVVKEARV